MELHNRESMGGEAAILGSRFVIQTDDDKIVYRVLSSCGVNLLFEVSEEQAYLIASGGSIQELEEYARVLAEDLYQS